MASGVFQDLYLSALPSDVEQPNIDGSRWLLNGKVERWTGPSITIYSPVMNAQGEPIAIGTYPMMTSAESLQALHAAKAAFGKGTGRWPSMTVLERIQCVQKYTEGLRQNKAQIVNMLMWEICKTRADATKEVDRTIDYINDTIKELKKNENASAQFLHDSGILAQIRRVPLGVALVLGPFNYPFNETYTNLIPALLMGNTCILKTPRTGCMCHVPTLELFKDCFPPGVVNIIHGSGRETLPVLLEEGSLDIFAFIGTSKAAVDLQKLHPHPNRLRVCLGLDAKNPAIVCADADLNVAVAECVLGSLSFNGQRCTALKVLYVHEDAQIADEFVKRFCAAVDALKIGLPWQAGVNITPLPEPNKPAFLKELIQDALSKGAKIANARGGQQDRTIVAPTVLYPVTPAMRVYDEEQFGPLVPIVRFRETSEIVQSVLQSSFGQQASVFSQNPASVGSLIDILVNQVSRVNINAQCQRGPDIFPFTGRKNSACGTLSISDALRVFSIRSVVAFKDTKPNQDLASGIMNGKLSTFLRSDFLF